MALGGTGGTGNDVVIRINTDITGLTAGLGAAQSQLSGFAASAGSMLGGIATHMVLFGAAGTAVTRYGMSFIEGAIPAINEFEKAQSQVVSILADSEAAMASTGQTVTDMAKKISDGSLFSMAEVTQGMYVLTQAGDNNAQMLEQHLTPIAALATAQQADLAQTIDDVLGAMNAYGAGAEDTSKYTNLFAAALTESKTSMEDLDYGLKYITPTFSALKIPIEDAIAAWTMLNDIGYKGENSGRILRDVMMDIQNPTAEATEVMAAHGVQVYKNSEEMVNLSNIYQQAVADEDALTAAKKAGTTALANQKAASEAIGLQIRNINEDITEFKQAESDPHSALLDSLTAQKTQYDTLKEAAQDYYDTLKDAADEQKEKIADEALAIKDTGLQIKDLQAQLSAAKKKAMSDENPVIKELQADKLALQQKKQHAAEEYQTKSEYSQKSKDLSLEIRKLDIQIAADKNGGFTSDSAEVKGLQAKKEALQIDKLAADTQVNNAKEAYSKSKDYSLQISGINLDIAAAKTAAKTTASPEMVALQGQIDSLKKEKLAAEKKLNDDKQVYNDKLKQINDQKNAIEDLGKKETEVDKAIKVEKKALTTEYERQLTVLENQKNALTNQKLATDAAYQSMSESVRKYGVQIDSAREKTQAAKDAMDNFSPTGVKSMQEIFSAFKNADLTEAEYGQIFGKQSAAAFKKLVDAGASGAYKTRVDALWLGEGTKNADGTWTGGEAEKQAGMQKSSFYGTALSTENAKTSAEILEFQKVKDGAKDLLNDIKTNFIPEYQKLMGNVYKGVLDAVTGVKQQISGLITSWNSLDPVMQQAIISGAATTFVYTALLSPLVMLGGVLVGVLSAGFSVLSTVIDPVIAGITLLSGGIAAFTSGIGGMISSFGLMGTAALTTEYIIMGIGSAISALLAPEVLLAAAIVSLALIWITNFGNIQENTANVMDYLGEKFDWLVEAVNWMTDGIMDGLGSMWDGISEIVDGIINGDLDEIVAGFGDLFGGITQVLLSITIGIFGIVISIFDGIGNLIIDAGVSLYNSAVWTMQHLPRAIVDVITGTQILAVDLMTRLWAAIWRKEVDEEALNKLKEGLAAQGDALITVLTGGKDQGTLLADQQEKTRRSINKMADETADAAKIDVNGTNDVIVAKKALADVQSAQEKEVRAVVLAHAKHTITAVQEEEQKAAITAKYSGQIKTLQNNIDVATKKVKDQTRETGDQSVAVDKLTGKQGGYADSVTTTGKYTDLLKGNQINLNTELGKTSGSYDAIGTSVDGVTGQTNELDAAINKTNSDAAKPLPFPSLDQAAVANTNNQLDEIIRKMQQIQYMAGQPITQGINVQQTQTVAAPAVSAQGEDPAGYKRVANTDGTPGWHYEPNAPVEATDGSVVYAPMPSGPTTSGGSGTVTPYTNNNEVTTSIVKPVADATKQITTLAKYMGMMSNPFLLAGGLLGSAVATGISNYLIPHSPVKEGPLKELGDAGVKLMDQFASGLDGSSPLENVALMATQIVEAIQMIDMSFDRIIQKNLEVQAAFMRTSMVAKYAGESIGSSQIGDRNITISVAINAPAITVRNDSDLKKMATELAPMINAQIQPYMGVM